MIATLKITYTVLQVLMMMYIAMASKKKEDRAYSVFGIIYMLGLTVVLWL